MEDTRTKEIRQQIQQIRRRRLLEFVDSFKGKGGDAKAAAALGIAPGFLSQLKLAKGGRSIGEALARRLEETAGLPAMWFDNIVVAEQQLSIRELNLLKSFRGLSPEAKQSIETILDQIKTPEGGYSPRGEDSSEPAVLHERNGNYNKFECSIQK